YRSAFEEAVALPDVAEAVGESSSIEPDQDAKRIGAGERSRGRRSARFRAAAGPAGEPDCRGQLYNAGDADPSVDAFRETSWCGNGRGVSRGVRNGGGRFEMYELRNVLALRNLDSNRVVRSVRLVVFAQTIAQPVELNANNGILFLVEARRTA